MATATKPRSRPQLTFPPLVSQWTVRSKPNWPGAEYTRRTRLKTTCDKTYSAAFMKELEETLGGEGFETYKQAMRPTTNAKSTFTRGRPPAEKGRKKITPGSPGPRRAPPVSPRGTPQQAPDLSSSTHSLGIWIV